MKLFIKIVGIQALIYIIGFSFYACIMVMMGHGNEPIPNFFGGLCTLEALILIICVYTYIYLDSN